MSKNILSYSCLEISDLENGIDFDTWNKRVEKKNDKYQKSIKTSQLKNMGYKTGSEIKKSSRWEERPDGFYKKVKNGESEIEAKFPIIRKEEKHTTGRIETRIIQGPDDKPSLIDQEYNRQYNKQMQEHSPSP